MLKNDARTHRMAYEPYEYSYSYLLLHTNRKSRSEKEIIMQILPFYYDCECACVCHKPKKIVRKRKSERYINKIFRNINAYGENCWYL